LSVEVNTSPREMMPIAAATRGVKSYLFHNDLLDPGDELSAARPAIVHDQTRTAPLQLIE
jgi:hypothetical protein